MLTHENVIANRGCTITEFGKCKKPIEGEGGNGGGLCCDQML